MTTWHEYVRQHGTVPPWPYPIRYGEERIVRADVLVVGGGIAGCHAAINARRAGVTVAVLEKEAAKWSGNGGAGVDHWLSACTNPCSGVTPGEFTQRMMTDSGGYDCGPLRYINAREGWDALLDCEQMGVQIRDVHGQFRGAGFRDDETGLMFAYDYRSRIDIRVYGHNMKPRLHRQMKRLGVEILDRIMLTALLTEDGVAGRRVVGAMGIQTRTGETVIVRAKATVLATGLPGRLWNFTTEYRPTFRDPNLACDGVAAAWNAGAEGQVGHVEDHEQQDDQAAPDHGPGGHRALDVARGLVGDRAGAPLVEPEDHAGGGVRQDRGQQHQAGEPQHPLVGVEEAGVGVDLLGTHVDLEVPEEVGDHVQEEHDAREGHQELLAHRVLPEEGEGHCAALRGFGGLRGSGDAHRVWLAAPLFQCDSTARVGA